MQTVQSGSEGLRAPCSAACASGKQPSLTITDNRQVALLLRFLHPPFTRNRPSHLFRPFPSLLLQQQNPQVALSRKSPYVQTAHRVSGLMLANHTSIRHLFTRCLTQYDKLMRRRAFLDNYEQHGMFKDDLSEFEDSREILENLAEEYKACESSDYINWVSEKGAKEMPQ